VRRRPVRHSVREGASAGSSWPIWLHDWLHESRRQNTFRLPDRNVAQETPPDALKQGGQRVIAVELHDLHVVADVRPLPAGPRSSGALWLGRRDPEERLSRLLPASVATDGSFVHYGGVNPPTVTQGLELHRTKGEACVPGSTALILPGRTPGYRLRVHKRGGPQPWRHRAVGAEA
jgi:hypothetical protein